MIDTHPVRERLLGSALRLFIEEGYEQVSVDRLRRAAEVSNGSFFHQFGSKAELATELLIVCVLDYQQQMIGSVAAETGARQGVAALVQAHVRWVDRHRDRARFMLDEARSAWFSAATERLAQHNAAFSAAIDRWRAPLAERGAFHPMPIEVFMATLIGPANLLCRLWLTGGLPSSAAPMRHQRALVQAAQRALVAAAPNSHDQDA